MATDKAEAITQYQNQLPKPEKRALFLLVSAGGSIASIIALIALVFASENNPAMPSQGLVAIWFLIALVIVLFGYICWSESWKIRNYSQSIYFIHYINHLIRDELSAMRCGDRHDLEAATQKILDEIASCFSVLKGRVFEVSLKGIEINPDEKCKENLLIAKDACRSGPRRSYDKGHEVKRNTAFRDLYYFKNGCSRYYLCNDLLKEYQEGKYDNTSFEIESIGRPETSSFLGFNRIKKWPLTYKSCLVLPVRYISQFRPPGDEQSEKPPHWDFWGFLCINCESRNVFLKNIDPELAGAIADAIYTFFTQEQEMCNRKAEEERE